MIGTASGTFPLLRELGAEPVTDGPGLADRVRTLAPAGISAAVDLAGSTLVGEICSAAPGRGLLWRC